MVQLTKGYNGKDFSENKGIHMTFENGNTISIQMGSGNYCNKGTAEIAIWNKDDVWYNFGNDEVKGYCNADEIAHYIKIASTRIF